MKIYVISCPSWQGETRRAKTGSPISSQPFLMLQRGWREGENHMKQARNAQTTPDPIIRFQRWFADAKRKGAPQPEAMALATVSETGFPSVRFVLLKHVDESGFVFFTDGRSRKGHELKTVPHAAATFYWNILGKQVRLEGRVEQLAATVADAYWQTRPRASQISASASRQSANLVNRAVLVERRKHLTQKYRGKAVPRPHNWTGFRLVPDSIEFWTHRDDRLHHREVFVRTVRGWKCKLLSP
jgi:pyridoxamine 5'-phosphate oxidase